MPDRDNYPATIERDEDGRDAVSFPDFGWGASEGATTRDEALAEARDLLREFIAATMRSAALPEPSPAGKRRPLVVPLSGHAAHRDRRPSARRLGWAAHPPPPPAGRPYVHRPGQ